MDEGKRMEKKKKEKGEKKGKEKGKGKKEKEKEKKKKEKNAGIWEDALMNLKTCTKIAKCVVTALK